MRDEEEEDFQRQLDEEGYEARDTRLVFADWLQDRNDPRAEGYRILAAQGIYSNHYSCEVPYSRTWRCVDPCEESPRLLMPHQIPAVVGDVLPQPYTQSTENVIFKTYASRRLAEDSFALALASLTPEQRAEVAAMRKREYWRSGFRDPDENGFEAGIPVRGKTSS